MIKHIEELIQRNNLNEIKKIINNENSDYEQFIFGYASQIGRIDVIKLLINDISINPSNNDNLPIKLASVNGYLDIAELLLTDNRVNPSTQKNRAIQDAYNNRFYNIVKVLWNDNRVKESLEQDNHFLFNELVKNDVKEKIFNF
jgi:hypothetical protein